MNQEFLQRQGSGSEESSSLSEPDLFRNVKSLPESTSSAGMLQWTNCSRLHYISLIEIASNNK